MNDTIKSTPAVVFIQENGIIRLPDGRFIARLDDEVSYESLPLARLEDLRAEIKLHMTEKETHDQETNQN